MKKSIWLAASFFVPIAASAALVGSWQFDDETNPLRATIGADAVACEVISTSKPKGSQTVAGLGEITLVDGESAGDKAVAIPYNSHLRIAHGLPTDSLTSWSLEMRIYIPADAVKNRTFFSINSQNNAADADLFLNGSSKIGGGLMASQTGNYVTEVTQDAWHTIIVRNDLSFQDVWLDGVRVCYSGLRTLSGQRTDLTAGGGKPDILICADDDTEDRLMHVSSVKIYNETLSDAYVANIPTGNLIGWWEFNPENPTKATIGQDLVQAGNTANNTSVIGQNSHLITPVSGIFGNDGAQRIGHRAHYRLTHGLPTDRVPTYTIMMDVRSPKESMGKFRTLIQTNSNNSDDGDICFQNTSDNKIGLNSTAAWGGYSGFTYTAENWCRVTMVYNTDVRKVFIDGKLVRTHTNPLSTSFFNLQNRPTIIIFGDNDGDDYPIDVSNVMIFDYPMSDAEALSLGAAPSGTGVPRGEWDLSAGVVNGKVESLSGEPLEIAGSAAASITAVPGPDGSAAGALTIPQYSWLDWLRTDAASDFTLNTYSYVFDIRVPEDQLGWVSFYTTSPGNSTDGRAFIYPNSKGFGEKNRVGLSSTIGYTLKTITRGEWTRVTIVAALGNRWDIYFNGEYAGRSVATVPAAGSDWAAKRLLHFLADNNGEHNGVECSYIAAYDHPLMPWEVASLGGVRMPVTGNALPQMTAHPLATGSIAGTPVTFTVDFSDAEGDPALLQVDLGNGVFEMASAFTASPQSLSATYPVPGVYTPRARLRTPDGRVTEWQSLGSLTVGGEATGYTFLTPIYQQNITTSEASLLFASAGYYTGLSLEWESPNTSGGTLAFEPKLIAVAGSLPGDYRYRVRITGLPAGETVSYRLMAGEVPVPGMSGTLKTNPAGAPDFAFSVWGDSQQATGSDWSASGTLGPSRMFTDMTRRGLDFGMTTGDLSSTPSAYANTTKPYFVNHVPGIIGAKMPFYIAWGNHDCYASSHVLRDFVEQPSLFEAAADYKPGNGNFHFYYANCLFVCLDWGLTGAGSTSESASPKASRDYNSAATQAWVTSILTTPEAQAAKFKFFFMHNPPYCELWGQDLVLRGWLKPLLDQYGVDFCFGGHTHEYERSKSANVNYIVSGCMSYLDHTESLTATNEELIIGGRKSVPALRAKQSASGVLGPAAPIDKGLFHGYGTVSVKGDTATYQMHGFNADGSYIGVVDSVTVSK